MANRTVFKVGIVGCGNVGMSAAYATLVQGIATDLVLVSRNLAAVEGEKLDLEHALPFLPSAEITASDEYSVLKGCDVVVFSAGAAQKPGETRLDLAKKNLAIVDDLIPKILDNAPHAVILMVTNPVDVLTYRANEIAGFPKGQIFGTGTTLDTGRFRFHLGEILDLNPRSIHTYILGEHGDSSFPALHSASVGGQRLLELPDMSEQKALKAYELARNAAYKIIEGKGATYYAIGAVIASILKSIARDARSVLPVTAPLHDFYGLNDVALSVPCIVGYRGIERTMMIELSENEQQSLQASADVVRSALTAK